MALSPGTAAPVFSAPSKTNPKFGFESLGGRYVVLAFLPPPGPERETALAFVRMYKKLFANDDEMVFFGVLPDAASFDAAPATLPFRWFSDPDGDIRRMFNAQTPAGALDPLWMIVDPALRILASAPLSKGRQVMEYLAKLPPPDLHAGVPTHAPVLIVPRVFEPALCRKLIQIYHEAGGTPTGVMRESAGKTVQFVDDFKKRRDATIEDETLIGDLNTRILHRLLPQVRKVFQFRGTLVERYIVACYGAEDGGYFKPHRDNTTAGTAHRRFAVSINLNAEEYEGGDLRFREYGAQTYRPPTGGALVFSCSLLHEVTPVTRGTRYAFLPFLYDDAGAQIREQNAHMLSEEVLGQSPL